MAAPDAELIPQVEVVQLQRREEHCRRQHHLILRYPLLERLVPLRQPILAVPVKR